MTSFDAATALLKAVESSRFTIQSETIKEARLHEIFRSKINGDKHIDGEVIGCSMRDLERGSCFPIRSGKTRHVFPKKNDVRHLKLSVPHLENLYLYNFGSTFSSKSSENKNRSISRSEFKTYFAEDGISHVFAGVQGGVQEV